MNFKDFLREGFFRPDGNLVSDPGYLYHATNEENLMDIKASGRLDVFGPTARTRTLGPTAVARKGRTGPLGLPRLGIFLPNTEGP